MKKIIKRFIAYTIDMLIVLLIITCLANTPINKQLKTYNKYYNEYQELYNNYQTFRNDLSKYYSDNKITEKEYKQLIDKYSTYQKDLADYYNDKKITKKEYNKIIEKTTNKFQKQYKKTYYNLSKYSTIYNIICILVISIYFIGFNIITNGQTLGKKILKLKINSIDNNKVSIFNYLIRTIILYNPIYYLAILIGPYIFKQNDFYTWAIVWSNIKNYLNIIIIVMIIIRLDGRGLHDLLAKTKVISLEEETNQEKIVEEIKEEKVKNIKHTQRKRKSNKKIIIDEIKEDE